MPQLSIYKHVLHTTKIANCPAIPILGTFMISLVGLLLVIAVVHLQLVGVESNINEMCGGAWRE
jgi:hypothetical protein